MTMKLSDWILLLGVGFAAALFVEALVTGVSAADIITSLLAVTASP
jgi:hypothetical protein